MSGRVSQQQQKQQAPMQSRCGVRLLVSLVLVLTTTCAVCAVADPPSPTDSSPQQVRELQVLTKLFVPSWGPQGVVPPRRDNNGGSNCAACQIVLTLLMQYADMHEKPIGQVVEEVCTWLPSALQAPCKAAINKFGPMIIVLLEKRESPVVICRSINICYGAMCVLDAPIPYRDLTGDNYWATRLGGLSPQLRDTGRILEGLDADATALIQRMSESLNPRAAENPWDWIKDRINRAVKDALPFEDLDKDGFSLIETLRGSSWRGKDCNDFDGAVYPGRRQSAHAASVDHNCNGIKGTSPNGQSYEDLLCGGTQRGTIVLGDSAAAHFSIPPQILHAASLRPEIFEHVLFILENEIDWPELSAYTGYCNTTFGLVDGPTNSIYSLMLERNKCNHRDYQNIAQNGARADDVAKKLMYTMHRNQTDYPALVFHALIGNDVCNGRLQPDGSIGGFTKVEDFEAAVLKTLSYLDDHLAPGSSVVFIGLADGRILWDTMHSLQHPIGATYQNVYEILLCLDSNPCFGWLNPNETFRNATSEHAAQLSAVYPKIMAEHQYKNFDMAYYSFVDLLEEAIEQWTKVGGQVRDLIEAVDGFHPSQRGLEMIAQILYKKLEREHPDMLGALNPHNSEITMLFGDQGGY